MLLNSELMTLKSDVVIEPLIARWHAWSHLISPATAALNLNYRLLTQMQSFIEAPDLHEMACKNPSLRGGPFIDLPKELAPQIQALMYETKEKNSLQIEFGKALKEYFISLLKQTDGMNLDPIYQTLPDVLRGYIELTYTLGGFPDMKVIEALLYESPIYDPRNQSALIYRQDGDQRKFAFSTPRLNNDGAVHLARPFCDSIYDFLAKLRVQPMSYGEILAELQLDTNQIELFNSFLTPAHASNLYQKPARARWRYFGHACVLIESSQGVNVLIDPVVAYENESALQRYTLADLPDRIDYVVLTHNHSDHVALETLLALRWKIDTIIVPSSGASLVDPSLKLMLKAIGFKRVIELNSLEKETLKDIEITAIPFLGEHGDLDIRTKSAWLVNVDEKKLLFAADSNNLDPILYDHLRKIIGALDTLFIGMECVGAPLSWVYGPLLPLALDRKKDQSRRLNGSDFPKAMQVVKSLGCQNVFIYALGMEPWMQFITSIDPSEDTPPIVNSNLLISSCREFGIKAERLYGHYEETLI
jgi:L-ascorbate metabolism protein UlaG (beta-lactamase superfamily)